MLVCFYNWAASVPVDYITAMSFMQHYGKLQIGHTKQA